MLYEISAGGIAAYCSDLIIDPLDREYVCFLSVAGHQTAVKGLLANLLENQGLTIIVNERFHRLFRLPDPFQMKIKKLPSGLGHGIAFPKTALPQPVEEGQKSSFLLIGRDLDRVKSMFYRHVEQKTDLPLHPSWTDWLWRQGLEQTWLRELTTLAGDFQGFTGELDQEALQNLIGEAIRRRDPEITACLRPVPRRT